jgi:sugar phosphate isomerase/epimerase
MARPVTLFTGQWADLPLEELAPLAKEMGYEGLELACWGDHFEVDKALKDDGYVERRREILEGNGLKWFAIGNHLVGQAVCDPIDDRHRATLPPNVWGDGDPEGVRQRAAEEMENTARAASKLGVDVVTGFTAPRSGTSSTSSRRLPRKMLTRASMTSPRGGTPSSTSSTRRA